uniref:ELMO domain-containing protein n=1 Tax=Aegilops tauschii subsp. strangulata TaxID=200361 RepID=A0A453LXK4_AEGTS
QVVCGNFFVQLFSIAVSLALEEEKWSDSKWEILLHGTSRHPS